MKKGLTIKFYEGFDYNPLNALSTCDWMYNNEWFDFETQDILELLVELRNNNLIKDNYVHIPAGEYEVVELSDKEWIVNIGTFTMDFAPFFNDEDIKYTFIYDKDNN